MTRFTPGTIKSIAIIGAGPSGLATAKYLIAEKAFSKIVIYERRKTVGGIWDYTPLPSSEGQKPAAGGGGGDSQPCFAAASPVEVVTANLPELNTPMYEGLETNLPHMLMQFADAPFPKGTQLFPKREAVMQYLDDYANDVRSLIRFEHHVVDVRPPAGGGQQGWVVTTKDAGNGGIEKAERFDAVVATNGHCDWPLLPPVEGLESWSRLLPESLHHSVSYKNPTPFKDKRTLLVGTGPSGADISHQLATVCQHPLLVAQIEKSPYYTEKSYTKDYPTLISLNPKERAAKFEDGSIERDIDAILFCTGYAYRFPFLEGIAPGVTERGIGALPLYQYIFHIEHPTLALIETPEMIVPFPLAESQAAVVARVWSGRLPLPSQTEMQKWRKSVISDRGEGRGFHALTPPKDLEYMQRMYKWCCETDEAVRKGGDDGGPNGEIRGGEKGKMPKRWDEKACWLRMKAPEMRKAFQARGGAREKVLGYEELNFRFEGERVRNADES